MPTELSSEPVTYVHPHDRVAGIPDRLPKAKVQELSRLDPARALFAVGSEWAGMAAAMAACAIWPNVLVYVAAIIFIGARQHALAVLGHDASHFRLLPNRHLNDIVGNIFLNWPLFISVKGYRAYHGAHHRFLAVEGDGNRELWLTHDEHGEPVPDWVYPKTRRELVLKLLRYTLTPMAFRSTSHALQVMFVVGSWKDRAMQLGFYAVLAVVLTLAGWWLQFLLLWLVPLRTWHMVCEYTRLICEHSAVHSDDPSLADTRTTIPTWWERILILPRNIGYHIEHHWYPSVPFYNLPALHAELMKNPRFRQNAVISHSVMNSLADVTSPERHEPATAPGAA